jgi:Ni,Fe-hydrogenase maturation factor
MARSHNFKEHGIVAATYKQVKRATNIFTATDVIPAPSSASIVIVDMVISKGSAGHFIFFDDTTEIMDIFLNEQQPTEVIHFNSPIALTPEKALKVRLLDADTDWGVIVTYYLDHLRGA